MKMNELNEKKDSGFFRVRDAREVILEEIVLPCLMKESLNAEPRKNDGYGK